MIDMNSRNEKLVVTIVIPVYNSENTIEQLVDETVNLLSKFYKLEIILINDCSVDKSEEICISIYQKYLTIVKFYSLAKNVGEHNAVMAGLNYSTGDYVVIMDDDFQNPVSEVIKMVNFAIVNNNDVVYSYYQSKKHSFFRNIGSAFNDRIANIMIKKPKHLYLSSFKVLNKFLVQEVIKYDLPFPYIDGLILRITSNIGKVLVDHEERRGGKSGYTTRKLISLWLNMFTNFSIMPLRISIYLGFIFSILGFGLGILVVYWVLTDAALPMGYPSIMVTTAIFSGIMLIAIGMVGEYIGRMFMSQNKRPQYSIRKRFE
jgi:glycosyltransferase involved in cell wall biosynthesis